MVVFTVPALCVTLKLRPSWWCWCAWSWECGTLSFQVGGLCVEFGSTVWGG